ILNSVEGVKGKEKEKEASQSLSNSTGSKGEKEAVSDSEGSTGSGKTKKPESPFNNKLKAKVEEKKKAKKAHDLANLLGKTNIDGMEAEGEGS
ncbi:hypothetical protein Mgra_00007093, partial [Meloidogyne graminicola]